jgi:RHO1 GDP-GTP exchange protein 1/2
VWINGLKEQDIIPQPRRTDFLEQVFWNIHDIIAVNTRLRDALNKRQKHYAVVERIGDIMLDAVPHFGPFVSYGAHQLYGKYEFEKEKNANPAFAQFVDVCLLFFPLHFKCMDVDRLRLDSRTSSGVSQA